MNKNKTKAFLLFLSLTCSVLWLTSSRYQRSYWSGFIHSFISLLIDIERTSPENFHPTILKIYSVQSQGGDISQLLEELMFLHGANPGGAFELEAWEWEKQALTKLPLLEHTGDESVRECLRNTKW
jgi:hypothetical protein